LALLRMMKRRRRWKTREWLLRGSRVSRHGERHCWVRETSERGRSRVHKVAHGCVNSRRRVVVGCSVARRRGCRVYRATGVATGGNASVVFFLVIAFSLTVSRAWIAFTFSFALVAMPTVVVVIVRGVATTVKIYEVRAKSWWGSKLNLFWARRGRRVAVVRR
jgi:hypothetical protein